MHFSVCKLCNSFGWPASRYQRITPPPKRKERHEAATPDPERPYSSPSAMPRRAICSPVKSNDSNPVPDRSGGISPSAKAKFGRSTHATPPACQTRQTAGQCIKMWQMHVMQAKCHCGVQRRNKISHAVSPSLPCAIGWPCLVKVRLNLAATEGCIIRAGMASSLNMLIIWRWHGRRASKAPCLAEPDSIGKHGINSTPIGSM
jgi:hypothetical protein